MPTKTVPLTPEDKEKLLAFAAVERKKIEDANNLDLVVMQMAWVLFCNAHPERACWLLERVAEALGLNEEPEGAPLQ